MIETLHENEWVSLKKIVAPEHDVNGYVYSHETRCEGKIVAILPYRIIDRKVEFLVKWEMTPCWKLERVMSAITGGFDRSIEGTVVLELWGECGYSILTDDLISLGTSYGTKSTDTVYHLFTCDLTDLEQGEAPGDGTEQPNESIWISAEDIAKVDDPQVALMYVRWDRWNTDRIRKILENLF